MSHRFKSGFGLFLAMWLAPWMLQARSPSVETSRGAANDAYFPAGVFSGLPRLDRSTANWYGRTLAAMGEPSLFELRTDTTVHVYRFLWLPSFHRPVSVRLTINTDGTGSVIARSVDKHAGILGKTPHDSGKLILDTTNTLTTTQVQEVLNQLQGLRFWTMTSNEESRGMDGAEWVLEGVKNGKYHVVDRWSPEIYVNRAASNQEFATLCKSFLKLGGVDVKDLY